MDAARTPGEWEARQHNVIRFGAETVLYVEKDGDLVADCGPADLPIAAADAAFIAAASTAVPALLADVERLTGERDSLASRTALANVIAQRDAANMWCNEWKRRADAATAERDALAAELATVREAANVEWQEEHAARLVAEERLKAATVRADASQLEIDCID